jgi:tRNA dimethylallyltransferase
MNKEKVHVVVGPTATGKTRFADKLAAELNGELINVDSRQIYKYLDIGTNKGNPAAPVHLLSFLEPDQAFSAYEFRQLVYELIPQIIARGKTPILVGGTGLYVEFIVHPEKYNQTQGEINLELREELNSLSVEELQFRLNQLNSELLVKLNDSDRQNPRRLIRMIEKEASAPSESKTDEIFPEYDFEIHRIDLPIVELEHKINARVILMFADGIVQETQKVLDLGFPEPSVALQGIGYREVLRHIKGEIDEVECIKLVQIAHRQYAKRQKTWFKKYLAGV